MRKMRETNILQLCIYFWGIVTVVQAFPPTYDHGVSLPTTRPLVVGHRGACGMLPEHTVAAYELAIQQGADVIECDVCVTKDLELVCMHESWMQSMTDVAQKFPDRLTTYFVLDQGENITDYFTVDFTLEELRTIRVNQRFSSRDPSMNGQYQIPTLEEYIQVAKDASRPVGIYPETKEPEWVNSLAILRDANTTFEQLLIEVLESHDYTGPTDPCFVQSFNTDSLYRLKELTNLPLIRLIGNPVSDADLDEYAELCYGIGPSKNLLITVSPDTNKIINVTDLAQRAQARGLRIHPYTFRNEYTYLAYDYGLDPYEELQKFLEIEIDGYFTDFTLTAVNYLEATYSSARSPLATPFLHFLMLFLFLNILFI